MELHDTIMGKHFFQNTMPNIARSLERIATSLEKSERERKLASSHDLLSLVAENPGLPIIPMVSSAIIADDSYSRWIASFGSARVDEYYVESESVFFRSEKDRREVEELVSDIKGSDIFESMSDEQANAAYDAAPWKRAIIVNINLPEN